MKRSVVRSIPPLIALALAPAVGGQTSAPIGIVLRVQGSAQLEESGARSRPAELGAPVFAGSRLRVQGSATVLLCSMRSSLEMKNGAFRISPSGVTAETGTVSAPVAVRICSVPSIATARAGGIGSIGGTLARDVETPLVAAAPLALRVSATPEFYWRPYPASTSYRIELEDARGGQVVWEREVPSSGAAYSGSARLAPGRYRWRLTALRQTQVLARAANTFDVESEQEAEAARLQERDLRGWIAEQPREVLPRLMLGLHLESAGRLRLALDEYRRAVGTEPNDAVSARLRELEAVVPR